MGRINWDSTADQILLATILETSEISVDVQRVAEAWPAEEDAKPTPRAVKERLNKIKEIRKNKTGGAGPTSPITPKKRTPRKAPASGSTSTPANKRKRVVSQAQRARNEKLAAGRWGANQPGSSENEESDVSEAEEQPPAKMKREKQEDDEEVKIKDEDPEEVDEKYGLANMMKETDSDTLVEDTIQIISISDDQRDEIKRKVDSKRKGDSKRKLTEEEEEALFADPISIPSSPMTVTERDPRLLATSPDPILGQESARDDDAEWCPAGKPLFDI